MSVDSTDPDIFQEGLSATETLMTAPNLMDRLRERGTEWLDNRVTAARMNTPPPPQTTGLFPAGQYDVRSGYKPTNPVMEAFAQTLPAPMPEITDRFNKSSGLTNVQTAEVIAPKLNTMGIT